MPNPSNPYASLLPELTEDQRQRLRDDIADNGVLIPVMVDEYDNILDGRHRWEIAQELGIDCPVAEPVTGLAEHDKRLLAVGVNVNRRQLTDAQATLIGRAIEPDVAARAKERMAEAARSGQLSGPSGESRDEVADTVGLGSGKTYERHAKLIDKIEAEHPDLLDAVVAGVLNTDDGKQIPADTKAVRKEVARREAKAKQDEMTKAQDFLAPQLSNAAAVDWLRSLPQRSADLLITDPPYATDVDDIASFAADWVGAALDLVKPTGRAYIFTGAYPNELHAYLGVLLERTDLTLANVLAWHYPDTLGATPKLDYKSSWQAIFYLRGPEAPDLNNPVLKEATTVQQVNMNSGVIGGRVHSWQKPDALADRLILHATQPGDTVVDCFAGTGTFLVAAGRLGRKALGCELDPEMVKLAMDRGCNVV